MKGKNTLFWSTVAASQFGLAYYLASKGVTTLCVPSLGYCPQFFNNKENKEEKSSKPVVPTGFMKTP